MKLKRKQAGCLLTQQCFDYFPYSALQKGMGQCEYIKAKVRLFLTGQTYTSSIMPPAKWSSYKISGLNPQLLIFYRSVHCAYLRVSCLTPKVDLWGQPLPSEGNRHLYMSMDCWSPDFSVINVRWSLLIASSSIQNCQTVGIYTKRSPLLMSRVKV